MSLLVLPLLNCIPCILNNHEKHTISLSIFGSENTVLLQSQERKKNNQICKENRKKIARHLGYCIHAYKCKLFIPKWMRYITDSIRHWIHFNSTIFSILGNVLWGIICEKNASFCIIILNFKSNNLVKSRSKSADK